MEADRPLGKAAEIPPGNEASVVRALTTISH
jgi:hypothetical protein